VFEKRPKMSHLNHHLNMAKIQPLQFGAKIQILNPNAPNYFSKFFRFSKLGSGRSIL